MKSTDELLTELVKLKAKYEVCTTRYAYILGERIRKIEAELMKRALKENW